MKLTIKNSAKSTSIIFILLSFLIYLPIIFNASFLELDFYLVEDLMKVHSLADYFQGIAKGTISDIQPIRDITYFFDILFYNQGFQTFIFTNFLIWIGTGITLIDLIYKKYDIRNRSLQFLILVFFFHPTLTQLISLVVARKHLLAFFFLTLTLKSYLSDQKKKATLFYLLSLLSHPINILFSVWLFLKSLFLDRKKGKDALIENLPLLTVSLIIGFINIWWYQHVYQDNWGITRHAQDQSLGDIVLAFGRYFSFLFLPFNYATFYGKQSPLSLAGIFITPIFFLFISKKVDKKLWLSILVLIFLSLFPVTYQLFHFFVSDTYILTFMSAIFFLILKSQKNISENGKWWILPILSLFIVLSGYEAYKYKSSSVIKEASYHNDPNCSNHQAYVADLFKSKRIKEAVHYGNEMIKEKCIKMNKQNINQARILYARVLVFSDEGDFFQKEKALIDLEQHALYFKLARATLNLRNHYTAEAFRLMNEVTEKQKELDDNDLFISVFKERCLLEENKKYRFCKN